MSEHQPQFQFGLKALFAMTTFIASGLAVVVVYPWLLPPVILVSFFACAGAFLGALGASIFREPLDVEAFTICGFIAGGLLGLFLLFVFLAVEGLSGRI